MTVIRRARASDAPGIAAVHVGAWRSAYANLLPADYLAGLSVARHAARHHTMIGAGHPVLVAEAEGRVVGFCSMGKARVSGLGEGEIEALYIQDDWRDQGIGRRLLQGGAAHLAETGCGSLFLWVLKDNPSRWFYERLGGKPVFESATQVAGRSFQQVAYQWDPITLLTEAGV